MSLIRRPDENHCPGIEDYVRPKVDYGVCGSCGGRMEFWSDEQKGVCLDCGAEAHKQGDEPPACLEYCDYAAVCKGIILRKKKN